MGLRACTSGRLPVIMKITDLQRQLHFTCHQPDSHQLTNKDGNGYKQKAFTRVASWKNAQDGLLVAADLFLVCIERRP